MLRYDISTLILLLIAGLVSVSGYEILPTNGPQLIMCKSTDCPQLEFTGGYTCMDGNIVMVYNKYSCNHVTERYSECTKHNFTMVVDICDYGEKCVLGYNECLPESECGNGIKDQNEDGIDCGGSCGPCPTCDDRIKNQDETDIDCGGPCKSCNAECNNDADCGTPHYGFKYCYNGSSVRDYISYKCINPGKRNAYCSFVKNTEFIEYCNPYTTCVRGECVDKSKLRTICMRKDCCDTDFRRCDDNVLSGTFPTKYKPEDLEKIAL